MLNSFNLEIQKYREIVDKVGRRNLRTMSIVNLASDKSILFTSQIGPRVQRGGGRVGGAGLGETELIIQRNIVFRWPLQRRAFVYPAGRTTTMER